MPSHFPITVSVTQDHIERGRSSSTECPIALAFLDLGLDVEVDQTHISILDYPEYCDQVPLPPAARHFIRNFDEHDRDGDPFVFTISEAAGFQALALHLHTELRDIRQYGDDTIVERARVADLHAMLALMGHNASVAPNWANNPATTSRESLGSIAMPIAA